MCLAYSSAILGALIVSLHGRNIAAFEQSWSIIVRMLLYPCERGNLTIRSMATCLKGRATHCVIMGNNGGFCFIVLAFVDWQVVQPLM